MKCRLANSSDLPILKDLWYECFLEHDSKDSIDYYFANSFDLKHTFVLEVANEIVCSLQLNQHQIFYQNEVESVSFVVGVATFIKQRKKGYMKVLLNFAIEYARDTLKQNYMILQAYDWNVYRSFGFYEAYFKKEKLYTLKELEEGLSGTEREVSAEKLLAIYQKYTCKLEGYKIRSVDYYEKMLKMYQVEGVKVLLTDEAYLLYVESTIIDVHECAYTSKDELEKALSLLANKYHKDVKIVTDILYDEKDSEKILYMMVKDLNKKFKVLDNLYISEEI